MADISVINQSRGISTERLRYFAVTDYQLCIQVHGQAKTLILRALVGVTTCQGSRFSANLIGWIHQMFDRRFSGKGILIPLCGKLGRRLETLEGQSLTQVLFVTAEGLRRDYERTEWNSRLPLGDLWAGIVTVKSLEPRRWSIERNSWKTASVIDFYWIPRVPLRGSFFE